MKCGHVFCCSTSVAAIAMTNEFIHNRYVLNAVNATLNESFTQAVWACIIYEIGCNKINYLAPLITNNAPITKRYKVNKIAELSQRRPRDAPNIWVP